MPDGFFAFWEAVRSSCRKTFKRNKRSKHRKGMVCCYKCGLVNGTLRKIEDDYICNSCYKELQNG